MKFSLRIFSIPIKPFLILVLLTLLPVFLWSQDSAAGSHEEKNQTIRWKGVNSADSYMVEIYRDEEEIFSVRTEDTKLSISLFPGTYRYRVAVINKFGKPGAWSSWSSITVEQANPPFIELTEAVSYYENSKNIEISVTGRNVHRNAVFFLERGAERISLKILSSEDGAYTLSPSGGKVPDTGLWNLSVTNPSGKSDILKRALEIKEYLIPEISSVSPEEIIYESSMPYVNIKGSGFEEGCSAELEGPGNIEIVKLEYRDRKSLNLHMNTDKSDRGFYSLVVTNPNGERTEMKEAFEVIKMRISGIERDDSESYKRFFTYAAGVSPEYFLSGGGDLQSKHIGAYQIIRLGFKDPLIEKFSFLKQTGLMIHTGFRSYDIENIEKIFLNTAEFDLTLFYITSQESSLRFMAGAGLGFDLNVLYNGRNQSFAGASIDPSIVLSTGAIYEIIDNVILDFGVKTKMVNQMNNTGFKLQPYAGIGLCQN